MTLELKEFLEDLQYVYNYSEKTVDSYRRDIEKFYDFFLSEGSTIEEVDNIIIRNFLNKELEDFDPKLIKKPQIVIANKMDIEGSKDNLIKLTIENEQVTIDVSLRDE